MPSQTKPNIHTGYVRQVFRLICESLFYEEFSLFVRLKTVVLFVVDLEFKVTWLYCLVLGITNIIIIRGASSIVC
jgi:hypothetical protein